MRRIGNVFEYRRLIVFVLVLSILCILPKINLAKASPVLTEGTQSYFNINSINGSMANSGGYGPLCLPPPEPYMAGFMASNEDRAKALRVTASFAGTNKAVIQSDNVLGAGIAGQGPHQVKIGLAQIDWAYAYLHVLDGGTTDPYLEGDIWKVWEWGRNGLWPLEPPDADLISHWSWSFPGVLTVGSSVRLTMSWETISGVMYLRYFAYIGGVEYNVYDYLPEAYQSSYFMLGEVLRDWAGIPMGETVKWFQFPGAWSVYNIGTTGWQSQLTNPSYIQQQQTTWTSVNIAFSVNGPEAYLDNTVTWGGGTYEHVTVAGGNNKVAHFLPNSGGPTSPSYELLWPHAPSGGGGCPYLYTWNGQEYAMDNNLLPESETSSGTDVDDYYKVESSLVPYRQGTAFSWYRLQIREAEQEHDYIDKVRLVAVDHNAHVNIAVTGAGKILTYKEPSPPISCLDGSGIDHLGEISIMDGNISNPATYYQGYPGDYLILNFGTITNSDAKLILRDDQKCADVCIEVQIRDEGDWKTIDVLHPRDFWAIEAVDLAPFIPSEDNLLIRLSWTAPHRLDFVGIDTTPQSAITIRNAILYSAIHSTEGNVVGRLATDDDTYVELVPGEQLQMSFILPNNRSGSRTFIFYTEGHYTKVE